MNKINVSLMKCSSECDHLISSSIFRVDLSNTKKLYSRMEAMMGWNACYSERQSQPWRCPPLPHTDLSAAGSWGAFGVWGEVSRESKQRVAWGFRAIDISQPVLSISVFSQLGWLIGTYHQKISPTKIVEHCTLILKSQWNASKSISER